MAQVVNKDCSAHASWSAILPQINSPLSYFALQLLVSESALSYCLGRFSASERVVLLVASLMAISFLLSFAGVMFLTYKAPEKILMRLERAALKEAQFRRAFEVLLAHYGQKKLSVPEIMNLVDGVLAILKDGSQVS